MTVQVRYETEYRRGAMQPTSLDEMLWPNRLPLQALGLWPKTTAADRSCSLSTFARFRLGFSVVGLSCLVGPQLYSVKFYWGDLTYLAETGSLVMPFALLLFKLLYMIARRRDFVLVYRWLRRFWRVSDAPDERATYESVARIAKTVSVVGLAACVADLTAIVGVAALAELTRQYCNDTTTTTTTTRTCRGRVLPVDVVYGFDYEDTPIFESMFVLQTIGLMITVATACASDASILTAIIHLIGQFRFINYRIRAIGRSIAVGKVTCVEANIGRCIKHHQIVVGVADSLSDLISPIVLGQLLCSGLQICISGYAIIEGNAPGPVLVKCIVLFASIMIQLTMWCVPGEFLDAESGRVAASVCHELPFWQLPTSLRRDLAFVILRAQRTCKVVAVYQATNVAKLTEVMKAAGSYMALLRSLKQ